MGPVKNGHIPVRNAHSLKSQYLTGNIIGFIGCIRGQMTDHLIALWQSRNKFLFKSVPVLVYKRVDSPQYLRRGPVVLIHINGLGAREFLVKIQEKMYVGTSPGIDSLIRISNHKKVLVISRQNLHQLMLKRIDILELINHNILKALLPLELNVFIPGKDIQGKLDKIVVIKSKALFLLIKISIKKNVPNLCGLVIFLLKDLRGHTYHIDIVLRLLKDLAHLKHVPSHSKGHVTKGQSPLLIDDLKDVIYV